MRNIKTLLLQIIILFYPVIYIMAENAISINNIKDLIETTDHFNHNYPQEKVFVHFDNSGYYIGEKIWYKAYVVLDIENQPTSLSKVLYVELLDEEGRIVESQKLRIADGMAKGDFVLKDQLKPGYYEIRAYTRLMLNDGEHALFSRVFPIFDKPDKEGVFEKKMRVTPRSQRRPDIRDKDISRKTINATFFPEGGNMIEGMISNVAFKITDDNGKSVDAIGFVINNNKDTICQFQTIHNGMGSFSILNENSPYKIIVNHKGKNYKFNLTGGLDNGYLISVNSLRDENLFVKISASENINRDMPLGLSVKSGGKTYFADSLNFDNYNSFDISIPKKLLPTGVNQITLFDITGRILAERLVFINNNDFINIEVSQSKESYQPYEEINIEFNVSDNNKIPVQTTLSVAVKDVSKEIFTNYKENILSRLLLSSDIKGYIENIDYYFEKDDAIHRKALDLLLMTQGWKRYNFEIMSSQDSVNFKHYWENGLIIDGSVLTGIRKKPIKNADVKMWLYSLEGDAQKGDCITDNQGKFNFKSADFDGEATLVLEVKEKKKRKNSLILLDRQFSPKARYLLDQEKIVLTTIPDMNIPITENMMGIYDNDSYSEDVDGDSKILSEIEVTAKRKSYKLEENKANIIYDATEELDKIRDVGGDEYYQVPEFLANINPYFMFDYYDGSISNVSYKSKPVIFFVNGQIIDDSIWKDINNIDMTMIETLMIIEDVATCLRYVPFSTKAPILVMLYTYPGVYQTQDKIGMRKTKFNGYYKSIDFYNPEYKDKALPEDFSYRRTIYWNPDVKTDIEGIAKISFYNNKTGERINIDAQTLTTNGRIGVNK